MKQTEHSFDNTERGRLLFSPGMKLADLVESNYELLVVLARMGIPLGFGESSVGEVCRQRGISAELFLTIWAVSSITCILRICIIWRLLFRIWMRRWPR